MMGSVSPETCWAIKKHWNNKFYYTVASFWFFLWDLYYDTRIHEHQNQNLISKIWGLQRGFAEVLNIVRFDAVSLGQRWFAEMLKILN